MSKTWWLRIGVSLSMVTAFCAAQAAPEESLVAKLNAKITPAGTFEATLSLDVSGQRSALYRDGLNVSPANIANVTLFGTLLQGKRLNSRPAVVAALENALSVQLVISRDNFVLPIQRQQFLQLDLVPFASATLPGRSREEITLAIPAGFTLQAESRLSQETSFARYQSEAKIDNGNLVVTREFEIKREILPADTDAEAFRRFVRDDQAHRFILRRTTRVDTTEWIRTVPIAQAGNYGLRAYDQREYEAARQLLQRAVDAKPNDAFAWNNLGRALAALGRLDDAQKAYERLIAISPKDRAAYNNLALVQERLGRWDLAIQSLQKQLEVHPGDSYATGNLPRAFIHAARWAEAEESASKALQLTPANASQKVNLAVARVCQGKAGRQEIDAALGARPSAAILNNAAYYLTDCAGQLDLAAGYANRALDLARPAAASPRSKTISVAISSQVALGHDVDTYGWILFKQGKLEKAIDLLTAGAALTPDGETWVHLAEAEQKAGKDELAAQYWREATYLEPGLLVQVPQSIAAKLASTPTLSTDREWNPLPPSAGLSSSVDQPSYFFVMVNADGSVQSVRELDQEDVAATRILPSIRTIAFPVVKFDATAIPAVYVVRVAKGADGQVVAARSVGTEAIAIASDLAPAEFPLPATAAPAASGAVGAPQILRKVQPEYSQEAHKAALAGTVRLNCIIGADGKPRDIKVLQSLGLGLDESAIAAATAWVYQPAVKDGQPVDVFTTLTINFHILGKWHSSRVDFRLPPDASRPVLEKGGAPKIAMDISATATLTFDVNEHGDPVNLHVDNTTEDVWAHDVSDAVRKWKFTPARKDGNPISVPCTMVFVRGE